MVKYNMVILRIVYGLTVIGLWISNLDKHGKKWIIIMYKPMVLNIYIKIHWLNVFIHVDILFVADEKISGINDQS